jgi:hypothetical protein
MATFVIFDEFAENISGTINLNTDTFKAALTNILPVQDTAAQLSNITQIAAGNGYSTGGVVLTGVTWAETSAGSGIWKFSSDDVTFTASGGDIAAHQYLVIYSDTSTNDSLVGYVDRGSSSTITSGNSRTWDVGANGWFTLAVP